MIRYLPHNEIDKALWDKTLNNSLNRNIYCSSWYLDIVSPGWDALILDDYKAIMPLTWKRKYGLLYLIQPQFAQQLGVFSPDNIEHNEDILNSIPHKFFYINICMNSGTQSIPDKFRNISHTNYILPLNCNYEDLINKYNRSTRTNLKRAMEHDIHIHDFDLTTGFNFLTSEYNKLIGNFNKQQKILFFEILNRAKLKGKVDCIGAFVQNKLLAVVIAIIVGKHICIQTIASEEGKKYRSLFLLYDFLIERYSGQDLYIDFGGSNIESIAYFFKGFGSIKTQYFQIKHSNLIPKALL